MSSDDQRSPEEWRELLRNNLSYPDEAKQGKRRERARARKDHRQTTHRETVEAIRQARRREPIRPLGAVLVVVVILGIGLVSRLLWPSSPVHPHAVAAPAPTTASAAPSTLATPSASASSSPTAAADLSTPNHVAEEAIRLYLTRNPPVDGDHTASVQRAAAYMEPALVQNLSAHDDKAYDQLVSNGGVATVTTVTVNKAAAGLPADTPLRVWRQVNATVDVQGYTHYTVPTVLQVEVTNDNGQWHVSRILGLGQ